mgnify:CR=1 FL=1
MNQLSERLNRLSPSATLAMSQKSNELKTHSLVLARFHICQLLTPAYIARFFRYTIYAQFLCIVNANTLTLLVPAN